MGINTNRLDSNIGRLAEDNFNKPVKFDRQSEKDNKQLTLEAGDAIKPGQGRGVGFGEARLNKEPLLPGKLEKIEIPDIRTASIGTVISAINGVLLKARARVEEELSESAADLDDMTRRGKGPTASKNQRIAELVLLLQDIQELVNRLNETATSLSRSQSDGFKSTINNLSV